MSEIKFNSGQSVQPAYEGWTRNPDGSRSMWFGYMNRNWEETPDIPAGSGNGFGAAGEDLGQPTHFLPRREAFVFKVDVPADWPVDKDLVWTLTANGTTLKAFGSLWPVWKSISRRCRRTTAAGRRGRSASPSISPRRSFETAAAVCCGSSAAYAGSRGERRWVAVAGNSRTRNRRASRARTPPDAPPPDPLAEAARGQFRVKWVQYRGAGKAKITPVESAVLGSDGRPSLTDGKSTTKVTFDRPGTYTLRAYALDGDAYQATQDVTITVTREGH